MMWAAIALTAVMVGAALGFAGLVVLAWRELEHIDE